MRMSLSVDSSGAYLAQSVLHRGLSGQLLDEEASSEPDAASGLAHHFELWEIRESGAPWEPVQIEDLAGGILLLYHVDGGFLLVMTRAERPYNAVFCEWRICVVSYKETGSGVKLPAMLRALVHKFRRGVQVQFDKVTCPTSTAVSDEFN